jgi:hypothetical protein
MSGFEIAMPVLMICAGIFILARIENFRKISREQKDDHKKELNRLARIDILYGRTKDD